MRKCHGIDCENELTKYKKKWCSGKCMYERKGKKDRGYVEKTTGRTDRQTRPVAEWSINLYKDHKIGLKTLVNRLSGLL